MDISSLNQILLDSSKLQVLLAKLEEIYSLPNKTLHLFKKNKELRWCIPFLYEKAIQNKLNHLEWSIQRRVGAVILHSMRSNCPRNLFSLNENIHFYIAFHRSWMYRPIRGVFSLRNLCCPSLKE
jgi:hypothetical protein